MNDFIMKSTERSPREWREERNGKRNLGGRWDMRRVSEWLCTNPQWQTVDDIARVVYGTTGKRNRDNVRRHISRQRAFMLDKQQTPIVTDYGERGVIMAIKIYDWRLEQDRARLRFELQRARDRKELSEDRFNALEKIFLLEDLAG